MSNRSKPLSIIICSLGRSVCLGHCLKSLANQSFKEFEVIIVSEATSIQNRGNFPFPIRIVRDPLKGLAVARDLGWRKARGELASWIDDDVIVDKNWAEEVVATFKDKSIGGVSGPTIIPENLIKNRLVFWWYGKKSLLSKMWIKYMLDGDPYQVGRLTKNGWWTPGSNFERCLRLTGLQPVDYLEACNMTIRRNLVEQVDGYDLKFKGTSEWCEVDLAMRVKRLGYKLVFNPKSVVRHMVSKSGVYLKRHNLLERICNYCKFRWKLWMSA